MSMTYTPIFHDFHFTLAYGGETHSEWRTVGVRVCDGRAERVIENIVADLASEIVRSGRAETVFYHGMVVDYCPPSGAFSGEVFAHEGEVCVVGTGGTGLRVESRQPSRRP